MQAKKILIICISTHHGNTLKIAKIMGEVFSVQVVSPDDVDIESLSGYDLIGFGSGIYNHRHHPGLFALLKKIKNTNCQKAFVFSTNTFGLKMLHQDFKAELISKNFDIIGEFSCPGFIDYSIIKYFFGGLSKNRPNIKDLEAARKFSQEINARL